MASLTSTPAFAALEAQIAASGDRAAALLEQQAAENLERDAQRWANAELNGGQTIHERLRACGWDRSSQAVAARALQIVEVRSIVLSKRRMSCAA